MPADTTSASDNSGYDRLEDQISWYNTKSITSQRYFRIIKVIQIAIAAFIPIASLFNPQDAVVPGALGAMVLALEGVQELGNYRDNWQKYRSACEALQHEKYLFMAVSGPYRDAADNDRLPLLAERVEELISEEHSNWVKQFKTSKVQSG